MKKGFTLIELLVVVLIIGILAAIALPQYQLTVAKSRYMQLMTMVNAFVSAEERYFLVNGHYTVDFEELDIEYPAGGVYTKGSETYGYVNFNGWKMAVLLSIHNVVYARSTSNNVPLYMHYLAKSGLRNRRECRAYNDSNTSVTERVCETLGAVKTSCCSDYKLYNF